MLGLMSVVVVLRPTPLYSRPPRRCWRTLRQRGRHLARSSVLESHRDLVSDEADPARVSNRSRQHQGSLRSQARKLFLRMWMLTSGGLGAHPQVQVDIPARRRARTDVPQRRGGANDGASGDGLRALAPMTHHHRTRRAREPLRQDSQRQSKRGHGRLTGQQRGLAGSPRTSLRCRTRCVGTPGRPCRFTGCRTARRAAPPAAGTEWRCHGL